jgi:hypothetical protein
VIVALLLLVVTTLAFSGYFVVSVWRSGRVPAELRGDWWSRFERDFRAYAAWAAEQRRRGAKDRRPPQR